MKQVALLARVTVWTVALVAALASRSVLADASPSCTDRLFTPPPTPHFTLPNAGPWEGYRGAAIEHDWPEARRILAGPRPPSFRPLRSLVAWLESLLMPRARHSATCVHCQSQPIGFDLGYDPLPADGLYYKDETPQPAPPPSPEFNPMPVPAPEAEGPEVAPSPMVPMSPVEPQPPKTTPTLPPMNELPPVANEPPVEPAPKATTPPEPRPAGASIVELAPEVQLPMDPPATTLPPRNTIPKATPRSPKNIVPLKGMPAR